jgi:hypothetical protein
MCRYCRCYMIYKESLGHFVQKHDRVSCSTDLTEQKSWNLNACVYLLVYLLMAYACYNTGCV